MQLLTLKGFMKQPLAKLRRRVTDRASNTKIRASQPKTFAQVLAWDTFCCEAVSRFEALEDTNGSTVLRSDISADVSCNF